MRWSWLNNRFVIVFGGIALMVLVWNLYVSGNNDGRITGQVVDASGAPVADATVVLSERTLLVAQPKDRTQTDQDGRFRFDGHTLHRLYLEANKLDVGKFGPQEFRLYFKGENIDLDEPITLAGGS